MSHDAMEFGITQKTFQCAEQMAEVLREGSAEFVQVSSGHFNGRTIRVRLENLTIHETWSTTTTLHRAAAHPDYVFFILPLSWSGELRWNGKTIEAPTLIVETGGNDYARRATDLGGFGFGLRQEDLLQTVASLAARPLRKTTLESLILADPGQQFDALSVHPETP